MAGESRAFIVWLSVLCIATCLLAIGLVCRTIALHPDAAGFLSIVTPTNAAVEQAPAPQVIHITDDPGGNVGEYYRKYAALSAVGAEIHFHGMCASACTMVLFTTFTGIKACADDGAIFAFHKPFAEKDGKAVRTKSAVRETRKLWAMWLQELPDPLHRYLQSVHVPSAAEGDEQNTLLILPASLLLPRCPVSVAAQ